MPADTKKFPELASNTPDGKFCVKINKKSSIRNLNIAF